MPPRTVMILGRGILEEKRMIDVGVADGLLQSESSAASHVKAARQLQSDLEFLINEGLALGAATSKKRSAMYTYPWLVRTLDIVALVVTHTPVKAKHKKPVSPHPWQVSLHHSFHYLLLTSCHHLLHQLLSSPRSIASRHHLSITFYHELLHLAPSLILLQQIKMFNHHKSPPYSTSENLVGFLKCVPTAVNYSASKEEEEDIFDRPSALSISVSVISSIRSNHDFISAF
ncbi:hypothetical protein QBC35DRAFT_63708 [Podospora australis]|uniref:Uncharacterized protein n=1 Tax=Podospora australis TaxID=1536484 RepID=A0AAN6WZW0_9PEZI|nr:hypothetical protein QBC35DRAFT_63708 [Podospora australis]